MKSIRRLFLASLLGLAAPLPSWAQASAPAGVEVATEPITEPVFFTSLMKIWLGANPPDWQLKDALLGQAKN